MGDVRNAVARELERIRKAQRPFKGYTTADYEQVAIVARDALIAGYLAFKGEPLSERQEQRKAGTLGAGKQLVDSRGPRLIEHIHAWVDGKNGH